MNISFFVPGKPVGKGRPRFTRCGHTYTPESTRSYEHHIRCCWEEQTDSAKVPLGKPIGITVAATFAPPSSASFKKQQAMIGKPHLKKPDLDNIVKSVLDALNGAAFPDDSAVDYIAAGKEYGLRPGVFVHIGYED